jgi:hypothetical protein
MRDKTKQQQTVVVVVVVCCCAFPVVRVSFFFSPPTFARSPLCQGTWASDLSACLSSCACCCPCGVFGLGQLLSQATAAAATHNNNKQAQNSFWRKKAPQNLKKVLKVFRKTQFFRHVGSNFVSVYFMIRF